MLSIVLLALAAPTPAGPAAPTLGPPAICFPVDIGEARSLPFGAGSPFATSNDYDLARVAADTTALLDSSQDTFVHMETLRRAAIYVGGIGRRVPTDQKPLARAVGHELVSSLRARVIDAVLHEDGPSALPRHALALRWFDLGYFLAALDQIGGATKDEFAAELGRAVELAPDDGALRLGVALGTWFEQEMRWENLDEAARRVRGADDLLAVNLVGTAGMILGCSDHEELRAEVRKHLAR